MSGTLLSWRWRWAYPFNQDHCHL